jgi:hypothetical protein
MELFIASLVLIAVCDLVAVAAGDGRPVIGRED